MSDPSTEGATQSTARENRRRGERFLYPTALQLTAGGHVLPAKLVDVSRDGMQVVAPVLLHVDDEVSACLVLPATIPTPGVDGVVRGRVCWTAPARSDGTPQTRAGIVFELPLSEAEPQRAIATQQEHAGDSVIVQFSGAMPQVMARASTSEAGTQLRFSLPCMREGSVITLHSQDNAPKEMRVVGARLDDDGALVELSVEQCQETRKRRFLQYDELSPALRVARPQPVTSLRAEATGVTAVQPDPLIVPKRRVLTGIGVAASLVAAAWIAGRISRAENEAGAEVATHAITQTSLEKPAPMPELVSVPDRRAAPAPHTTAAVSGMRLQPAATTTPDAAEPAVEPSATTPLTAAAVKPSAEPPKAGAISISSTRDTTEIFVPVTGSMAGLTTKIWSDPPAVVVEIPRGQVGLKKRQYDIQRDGVVGISVGRPGGITQLRLYVNSILSQYNATAVPGGVSIRIKRDLQPLP